MYIPCDIKCCCYVNGFMFLIHYCLTDGPAEDLYGIFINRVRRERPPEYLENVRG